MGKIKVPLAEVPEFQPGPPPAFPKYTTQLLNLANQTAHGTRPNVVGKMSELVRRSPSTDYQGWVEWYTKEMPDAIEAATERVWSQVHRYLEAGGRITREMVGAWVADLVLTKTYVGFETQQVVLEVLAEEFGAGPVRPSTPEDEARGIDGYLGDQPVSVKPSTYRAKVLPEEIAAPIVFYEKTKTHLEIDASQLAAVLNPSR